MTIELPFSGITRIIVLLLPVIISLLIIAFFLIKGKKGAELYSYVAFEILIFWWLLVVFFDNVISYVQDTFGYTLYDKYAVYFNISLEVPYNYIHVIWLVFVLFFTGNRQAKNKKLILSLFAFNSLLFIAAMVGWYYLFQNAVASANKIFGPCAVPLYAEFIFANFLLFKYAVKQFGQARIQAILIMVGASLPVIFKGVLDIFRYLLGITYYDNMLSIVYLFEIIFVSIAVFRYRFLNIVPIALRNLVDNMQPAILVIDMSNRVADVNTSFRSNFLGQVKIKINNDVNVFADTFRGIVDNIEVLDVISNKDIYYYNAELGIKTETNDGQVRWKYYAVNIQPVITKRKKILGRIILFNDVTEYKTLVENLNVKNVQLAEVNDKLEEYAATVEELTIVKERNRFARDVHDTIGHTLTLVVSLLSMARLEIKTNLDEVQEKINKAISIAREGMQEIRCSVAGLTAKNINIKYLVDALKVMSDNFTHSGIDVDLDISIIDNTIKSISPLVFDAVCKLYKEILTNSLKHGKATRVVARVEINNIIKITALDNGIGCKNIVKGFGLSGMQQRVSDLKGMLRYGTDGEKGFNVSIELPAC